MEEKENVYEGTTKTEQGTEVKEKGSAVLGKFKDVSALAEAYGSLQAEFTRRSQRLKELERELAKRSEAQETEKTVCAQADGSGKAEVLASDTPNVRLPEEGAEEGGAADTVEAEEGVSGETAGTGERLEELSEADARGVAGYSAEKLYEEAVKNEEVRLRIIGEYLTSLSRTYAPLTSGGRGTPSVSPSRAKSVADAGNMALKLFQKAKEQA